MFMETITYEIETLITACLNGRADSLTKQVITAWLSDEQNLPAFYEFLLRFELDDPMINTDFEQALSLCRGRFLKTNE